MGRNRKVKSNKQKDVFTSLVNKHNSPLVIRKYTHWGFPIYIGLIVDEDLSNLDHVVHDFMGEYSKEGWVDNIQSIRNLAGELTEHLVEVYGTSEGIAVVFYVDKMFVSSLHGDFMNHLSCRVEFYSLLVMSTGV